MKKVFLTVALALALTMTSVYALTMTLDVNELKELTKTEEVNFGAVSGPDVYFPMYFHDTIMTGGSVLASSTAANSTTGTLTSKDVFTNAQLDYTVQGSAISLTLPATSTISDIRYAGECYVYKLRVIGEAASTTTIVAGTGIDLMEVADGDASNVVIAGSNGADLRFCRESDTDITVSVAEYSPAD